MDCSEKKRNTRRNDKTMKKNQEIQSIITLLQVAGTITGDEVIEEALNKLTFKELMALHYRIKRACEDSYYLGECNATEHFTTVQS